MPKPLERTASHFPYRSHHRHTTRAWSVFLCCNNQYFLFWFPPCLVHFWLHDPFTRLKQWWTGRHWTHPDHARHPLLDRRRSAFSKQLRPLHCHGDIKHKLHYYCWWCSSVFFSTLYCRFSKFQPFVVQTKAAAETFTGWDQQSLVNFRWNTCLI